jgi:hypothetical protein
MPNSVLWNPPTQADRDLADHLEGFVDRCLSYPNLALPDLQNTLMGVVERGLSWPHTPKETALWERWRDTLLDKGATVCLGGKAVLGGLARSGPSKPLPAYAVGSLRTKLAELGIHAPEASDILQQRSATWQRTAHAWLDTLLPHAQYDPQHLHVMDSFYQQKYYWATLMDTPGGVGLALRLARATADVDAPLPWETTEWTQNSQENDPLISRGVRRCFRALMGIEQLLEDPRVGAQATLEWRNNVAGRYLDKHLEPDINPVSPGDTLLVPEDGAGAGTRVLATLPQPLSVEEFTCLMRLAPAEKMAGRDSIRTPWLEELFLRNLPQKWAVHHTPEDQRAACGTSGHCRTSPARLP